MIKYDFYNVKKLAWTLVIMFVVGSVVIVGGLLLLGGVELFNFLRVPLIQAYGLGMAITAASFFLLRLVWRLKAAPLGISIVFFIVGVR